jgi:hypothetical protein
LKRAAGPLLQPEDAISRLYARAQAICCLIGIFNEVVTRGGLVVDATLGEGRLDWLIPFFSFFDFAVFFPLLLANRTTL